MSARRTKDQLEKFTTEAVALITRCAAEIGDGSDGAVLAALHVGIAPAFGVIAAAAGCKRPNREQIRAVLDGFIALCEKHSTPRTPDPERAVLELAEEYKRRALAECPWVNARVSFEPGTMTATVWFRVEHDGKQYGERLPICLRDFVDDDLGKLEQWFGQIIRKLKDLNGLD